MKKYPFVFSLLLTIVSAQAQDYKISFAGTGESSSVDTVTVENLTQGTNIALGGSEILHLVRTSTGLNPLPVNADIAFHIYPNPMTQESTIEFVAIESGIAYIEIFDISGRRVGTVQNRLPIAVHSYIVSGLPSGIYTVRINSQAYTYTGKLISNGSPGTGIKISYKGNNAIPVTAQKLKSTTAEITMQYTTGDLLKITGRSGNYSTIIMDVPTESKTITFTFLPVVQGDEPLTAEEAAFLASVPDTLIHLEDIILENGENVRSFLEKYDPGFLTTYPSLKSGSTVALTPFLQKVIYIARMLGMGNHLVDDAQHTYPSEGADKPAQTGLAYSWGSKDEVRQKPPTIRDPGCNDKYIHGLDCSGMIWQMIQAANLNPPPAPKYNFFVSYITDAPKWTAAFKASADYKDLEMKDMGENYPKHNMKSGDMILWRKHVGIYLYGSFYQSNGDPNAPDCTNNLSQGRGPRIIPLSYFLEGKKSLGPYHVYRPVCDQQYTLTLTINSTGFGATSPFCILGNYIDSTVFKITVSEDNIVTLDSIKNSNPPVMYQSAGGCDCLSMTFSNGSVYEFTGLTAEVTENGSEKDFLKCYFIQTFCSSNDSIQCSTNPPMVFPGMVVPGNIMTAGINIPQAWEPITITSGQGITLTIKRELQ